MTAALVRVAVVTALVFAGGGTLATAQTQQAPIREAAARVSFLHPRGSTIQRDSNANGTAIGALVGAAGMGTFLAILWNQCRAGCENDMEPWAPYAAIGVGAAGGAAVGYLIDRARVRAPQKVAVMPSVTRRERSVKLAVRF